MLVNRLPAIAFCSGKGPSRFPLSGESRQMTSSDTLTFDQVLRLAESGQAAGKEALLEQSRALERFLASVERRAFRIAQMSLRDPDEALDVVQGAMLRLARSYGQRPSEEWKPLFYRILYNGIRDWQRRRSVRSRVISFWPGSLRRGEEPEANPIEQVPDGAPEPSEQLMAAEALQRLEQELAALPPRQQQAFVLRCLEGMDVAETAAAMGCSAGSVKTHYFRAVHTLREKLGEVW
jgi:RNA polymerase sigma-70 factor (ECF subfamily)